MPEGFYSSKFIVDKAIQQLENNQKNHEGKRKPFFSYVSFQAVHIPLQAPKEFTEKYIGRYREGWHALRKIARMLLKIWG